MKYSLLLIVFLFSCSHTLVDRKGFLVVRKSNKENSFRVDQSFNNNEIRTRWAQTIALKSRGDGPYLSHGTLYETYKKYRYEFRFRRIADKVERESLVTGEKDTIAAKPNKKGEYINIELFLKRRKGDTFGSKGNEVWYGGTRPDSLMSYDDLWAEYKNFGLNEINYTNIVLGRKDSIDYDIVEVEDFPNAEQFMINKNQRYYVKQESINSTDDRPDVWDIIYRPNN